MACHIRRIETPQPIIRDPCNPSPCGPNSQCRDVNGQASRFKDESFKAPIVNNLIKISNILLVCSCLSSYIGAPPNCRPECVTNSDCALHLACVNQRCQGTNIKSLSKCITHFVPCLCFRSMSRNLWLWCNVSSN